MDYKNTTTKQYHKSGRAPRTEPTINNSVDFEIRKGLANLPALREIGFPANRRLLRVQRLDHDPITGINVLHTVTDPITGINVLHTVTDPITGINVLHTVTDPIITENAPGSRGCAWVSNAATPCSLCC